MDGKVLLEVVFAVVSKKVLSTQVTDSITHCAREQDITLQNNDHLLSCNVVDVN